MPRDDDFPAPPATEKVDPDAPTAPPASNVRNISDGRRSPGRPRKPTKADMLAEAEEIVSEMQADAIGFLTPVAPVSAGTWVIYEDANTRAIMRLAAGHPALLKRILSGGDFVAYASLGTFVVAMLVSVGVEMGRVPGDGVVAQRLRVAEAFETVMEERERDGEGGGDVDPTDAYERRPAGGLSLPGIMGDG